jgi:SHS2 domain-containing protein
MAMFGYMTEIDSVEMKEEQEIEAEGRYRTSQEV